MTTGEAIAVLDAIHSDETDIGAGLRTQALELAIEALREKETKTSGHAITCRAYGNYQPPYADCSCGAGD